MIVKHEPSPLWLRAWDRDRLAERIEDAVRRGLAGWPLDSGPQLFFRADDVAAPGERCDRMFRIFHDRGAPLDAAVTPAWISSPRAAGLLKLASGPARVDFHVHGWRHVNHETAEPGEPLVSGGKPPKKCEFGPSRPRKAKQRDLETARSRMTGLFGDAFLPVFTPPWNRCDAETLELLADLDFIAVSRDGGALPAAPPTLAEFPVLVDLHTRREDDPDAGMDALLDELAAGLRLPVCGVMIHHQRMNEAAAVFLETLLTALADFQEVRLAGLRSIPGR
ncbi:polysaccharide deacetylase [Oceanidesulfovibrio indonesiensis]|uniref:Polysaccharide deacetylase n=1 Tax=Oceanidesulfovibrio indonesiensis TaxID=54767 RepID=A0A7M3MKU9_9BACT|nr:polysaccharide deacetylase [Oceanidesulfovibrio indonesiensis]TVM19986.1 polysaccharide deacetylase [Oceanidesulfovibrio indonesiensis]